MNAHLVAVCHLPVQDEREVVAPRLRLSLGQSAGEHRVPAWDIYGSLVN